MWGEIMAKRKMNATIYDVAELANVSLATASRVINGIDKVSEDTKQRVLEAIAELNYKPNTIAKSLASRKTTDVAIIVPEINYSYVAHTVAGLMDSAKKYGYDCLIFTTKGNKKDISETFEKVLSLRVNGVINFNDHLGESELKELLNFDVPVVCLATSIKDVSCVTFHYKDQVRTIVEECLNIKHKDVYFLSVEGHGMIEERILKAVKEAYMEKNIVFENMDVVQGKLVLGLDVNIKDEKQQNDVLLYNSILGGSANSKLFQNVREKASLAYTASSSYLRIKNSIFINCGIEIENYDKALKIIKEQISDMKEGKITDEEVENVKKGLISAIKAIDDEQDTQIMYLFGQEFSKEKVLTEEYEKRVRNVSKQDIIDVANLVKINTIYFLTNKDGGGENANHQ